MSGFSKGNPLILKVGYFFDSLIKSAAFMSLCSTASFAVHGSLHTAALMPGTLFAAREIPMPDLHTITPLL